MQRYKNPLVSTRDLFQEPLTDTIKSFTVDPLYICRFNQLWNETLFSL